MLSLLEQGKNIAMTTLDPLLSKANQAITTAMPEQSYLTQEKSPSNAIDTVAKAVQLGQNVLSLGIQAATGFQNIISQNEPLDKLMERKHLEEKNRYSLMHNQVVQKFLTMKNALEHHKKDHGQFLLDGSDNHAFALYPFDTYSFSRNSIMTDTDYIGIFFNKGKKQYDLYECDKSHLIKNPSPMGFFFNRWCSSAEYGKKTTGRISTLDKISTQLDLIKTRIYAGDIPGSAQLNGLQPEQGSYIDNIREKTQSILFPSILRD